MVINNNGHERDPIEGHSACPECGSEKRLIADFVAELREAGIIGKDSFPNSSGAWEIPFMDLEKFNLIQVPGAIRTFPTLRILFDICAECKTLYIIKVDFGEKGFIQQPAATQMKA